MIGIPSEIEKTIGKEAARKKYPVCVMMGHNQGKEIPGGIEIDFVGHDLVYLENGDHCIFKLGDLVQSAQRHLINHNVELTGANVLDVEILLTFGKGENYKEL